MLTNAQTSNMWIMYALLTVACWGVYGLLLHTGVIGMGDPQ